MKLWIKFLNAIYQVDEPIGTKDAIKIFFSCSNAISAYCGNFAGLSTDQRSFLGIKITL